MAIFCLAEEKLLCNFGRGHYGGHLCEIITKFEPVVQEMLFKIFLSTALATLLFGGAEPFVQFW